MRGRILTNLMTLAIIGAGIAISSRADGYVPFIAALVAVATIAGVGLNILIGLAGQMSFGHVGFYAIGAYTVSLLTLQGVNFWLALPLAALLTGAAGAAFALPALRVRGPHLAMMTIAFGFVVEHLTIEWRSLTGGQNGLLGIPPLAGVFGLEGERALGAAAWLLAGGSLFIFDLLARGRWGKAMMAVRDSEVAAASLGFSVTVIKTLAFTLSAVFTGIAGGCFAVLLGYIAPSTFPFSQSILFVLSVIVGGAGATFGPLIGAVITIVLPELISAVAEYRLLLFSSLLIVILWLAPEGLIGTFHRLFPLPTRPRRDGKPTSVAAFLARAGRQGGLRADGLSISFGGIKAARDVSFSAADAVATGLIGPNGAGKTTILNLISGFYRPASGSITLTGQPMRARGQSHAARSGIARTYQTAQLFSSLSVLDNVALAMGRGRLGLPWRGLPSVEERALGESLLRFAGYRGDVDVPAGGLAHVDQRLAEIARALALCPDVLLLDEPAAGLNAEDKAHLATVLRAIAQAGPALILVEHDMNLVMQVCGHLVALDAGQVIATGTPEEIRRNTAVQTAYLGEETVKFRQRAQPLIASGEMLSVEQLRAGYGAIDVLHGADLKVARGELVAVLGANGAGKSTLLKAISGLIARRGGRINFEGIAADRLAAHQLLRQGLALVPEGRQVFPALSVADNLLLGAYARNKEAAAAAQELLLERFPRLRERLHQRAGLLSGGEAQMLALARALMSNPHLLLLDEPTLGLAPKIVAELYALLASLRDEGKTILLVDQMARFALQIADRGYIMASGEMTKAGEAAALVNDPELESAYLGGA